MRRPDAAGVAAPRHPPGRRTSPCPSARRTRPSASAPGGPPARPLPLDEASHGPVCGSERPAPLLVGASRTVRRRVPVDAARTPRRLPDRRHSNRPAPATSPMLAQARSRLHRFGYCCASRRRLRRPSRPMEPRRRCAIVNFREWSGRPRLEPPAWRSRPLSLLALRPVFGIQRQGRLLAENDLSQHRMRHQRPHRRTRAIAGRRPRQNDDLRRPRWEIIRKPDGDPVIGGNGNVLLVRAHDNVVISPCQVGWSPCLGRPLTRPCRSARHLACADRACELPALRE
jgi:hypothetical protein